MFPGQEKYSFPIFFYSHSHRQVITKAHPFFNETNALIKLLLISYL